MTPFAGTPAAALGLIQVTGEDAGAFLRAQLTNDVLRLGPDRHFLAAWCDAKGRAVLVARIVPHAGGYLLLLPRTLVSPIMQRLRLYVLRARVELADVTADYRLDGVIGRDLPAANRAEQGAGRTTLGLPRGDRTPGRALVLAASDEAAPAGALAVGGAAWRLAAIDAGVPALYPATQGLFVPQMLNLHWLMAVDFDKGCYPGQEVIARLHYRGTLTRRLFRLAWAGGAEPAPGTAVTDDAGVRQGTVVRAAADDGEPTQGRLLAVLRLDAVKARLRAGAATLEMLDLPYPTPR